MRDKQKELQKWLAKPGPDHHVRFYNYDSSLVADLQRYIGDGLEKSDTCLIIATKEHAIALEQQLAATIDISSAKRRGQLTILDAAKTLNIFMINGMPNQELFYRTFKATLTEAIKRGTPVRAYGEMVDLLWKQGNRDAALQLEMLWNSLAQQFTFSLYCSYRELKGIMPQTWRDEVHACHDLLTA